MKRYEYMAGCAVSLADGSFGEIDIPCARLYSSEDEALQEEGRNAYRLIHVGGAPGRGRNLGTRREDKWRIRRHVRQVDSRKGAVHGSRLLLDRRGERMKSSVLGVIRVRSRGANDEASEYILKATINGLPIIGVYASVAPVPDSLVFQYQKPAMPSDPPKNARFWHNTQATVSRYESWTVTLVGNTEGRDRTEAIRKVQTYLRCLAHEFLVESVCIRIGDLRPYIISDAVTYQVLYEGTPSEI